MHLPDAEYQRCAPPDHIAAGATVTDDGRPMSINVEQIGTGLVIQHYAGETMRPAHCHMVSTSDVYTPNGRTQVQVVWDLSATATGDGRTEYTNRVTSHPTEEFLVFIAEHGISFEQAAPRPAGRLQRPQQPRDSAVRREHRSRRQGAPGADT